MRSNLSIRHVASSQELRECAQSWDDLWLRSDLTHPTAQASLIANWLTYFAKSEQFRAIVVAQGDRFLAALPLVSRTKGRLVACMDVPGNEWCSAGQFLLDPASDVDAVCDALVAALSELDCTAFWFASVPLEASWWQAIVAAGRRAGWSIDTRRRHRVGLLDLPNTWDQQLADMSAGLRKQVQRSVRRLGAKGKVRLHVARPSRGDRALGLLENGLALEHAGWKGAAGTSVLANDLPLRFIQDQARQLIEKRQLVVAMLEQNGHILAFEYGWCAKQVYHSYKVAYDEACGSHSPGQLMVYRLLQHFHETREAKAIDFLGPLDTAITRWRPRIMWTGRLLMAPPRPVGRAVVFASRFLLNGQPELSLT